MNTIKLTAVIEFTGENLTKEWAEKEFNSMQEVYLDNLKLYPEINSKLEELYGHIENVEDSGEREELWPKISALLEGTSEEEPMEVEISLPEYEDDACGLSELEIPFVDMLFQEEGGGMMWYHIDHENELDGSPIWRDLDELSIKDLRAIYEGLCEQK